MEKSQPLVSLCLIVGNVEEYIERCLKSFAPIADEIVVVRAIGNQTPDKTLDIAREKFGAVTGEYRNDPSRAEWPHVDSFAAARNASFDLATGTYLFWCDTDDVLLSGAELIREHAERGGYTAFMFPYAIHGKGLAVPRERMILKGSGKWTCAVHECFKFNIEPVQAIEDERVVVQHLPNHDKGSSSNPRNLRILNSIPEDEMTTGLLYHQHIELCVANEIAASVEVAKKVLARPDLGKPEKMELFLNLAQVAEDPEQKAALYHQAYAADPRRREPLLLLCNHAMNMDDSEAALAFGRQMNATERPEFKEWNERAALYGWLGDDIFAQALRVNDLVVIAEGIRQRRFKLEGGPRISLVHATRGRPKQAALARKVWLDTAAKPERVEHIFVYDRDDKESHVLRRFHHYEMPGGGGCVAAWNAGALVTDSPIIVQMSDDWVPPNNWDNLIIERIGDTNKPSVLAVSDGSRKDQLLCMAICTREYLLQDFFLFHPSFTGVYSDNYFTHLAYQRNIVIEARDLVFEHHHPAFGATTMDATYAAQNAPERYTEGMRIYNELLEERDWSTVPGWFNYYFQYGAIAKRIKDGDTIAEIGVWMGRSIIFMAQTLKKQGKRVKIYAIDTFKGEEGQSEHHAAIVANNGSLRGVFEANISRCGVADMIEIIEGDSAESAKLIADGSLSFCYIDAAHDYDSVKRDILAWKDKVKPGGILAGHDAQHEPVIKAVEELLEGAKIMKPIWMVQR